MLIPIAAKTNFYFLFACRFLTGFFHGPVFPSLGTVWSNWAPTAERSRMLGISISGIQIGNIIALPLGGYEDISVYFFIISIFNSFQFNSYLCVYGFDGGWPSIFYIYGAIGIVSSLIFILFISETPNEQKLISRNESQYILNTTKDSQKKAQSVFYIRV